MDYFDLIMDKNITQTTDIEKIRRAIVRGKYGSVYFASSFPNFNADYVSKLLATFEKEGLLERISKGVYLKARKTRFGISYPPIEEIVAEIAKRDKAKIIPTGETAANLLGFSDQVPLQTCFLTTGTYRTLRIGKRTVLLKNAAPKNFEFKNEIVGVLVQALWSIGKDNVTEEMKQKIPVILAKVPKNKYLDTDLRLAPVWIKKTIYSTL